MSACGACDCESGTGADSVRVVCGGATVTQAPRPVATPTISKVRARVPVYCDIVITPRSRLSILA